MMHYWPLQRFPSILPRLELYLPLLVGATLVLADAETAKDGRALLEAIPAWQISIIQATPVTYKMMLAAGWEQRCH